MVWSCWWWWGGGGGRGGVTCVCVCVCKVTRIVSAFSYTALHTITFAAPRITDHHHTTHTHTHKHTTHTSEVPKADSVRCLTVCRVLVLPRSSYTAIATNFPISARQVGGWVGGWVGRASRGGVEEDEEEGGEGRRLNRCG